MPVPANERGLRLLAEECFASEDDRFIETIREIRSPKFLAALADRWKKDPRPWARDQVLAYLTNPLDRPGHQPVIKRLFKQAEEAKDHELMAYFMVVFDRLVRRSRKDIWQYDAASRQSYEVERLVVTRDVLLMETVRGAAEEYVTPLRQPANGRLFSHRTRAYLRRRAWRYFRRLGFQQPDQYPAAVAQALICYTDEDLAKGENILDCWGLLQACFHCCDALDLNGTHAALKEGRGLNELNPAPYFPELWKKPESASLLFLLIIQAEARLVRIWGMQLLQREHPQYAPSVEQLEQLLMHDDGELQQFGAQLLENNAGIGKMPVSFWLRLLKIKNPEALQKLSDIFTRVVSADRIDFQQCLELACAEPTPVARIGFQLLKARTLAPADRASLAGLADAKCAALGGEMATWALSLVGAPECYDVEAASRFFDSLKRPIREAAWTWLVNGSAGYDDPVLWSRLTETPYDDLRLRLIDELQRRSEIPGSTVDQLTPVWCSVLLGIHRGGRQKAKAVGQIGEVIQKDPARAETLLPVLIVAVRSVRFPEARAGLAALVRTIELRPELTELVKSRLPELNLSSPGGAN